MQLYMHSGIYVYGLRNNNKPIRTLSFLNGFRDQTEVGKIIQQPNRTNL